MQRPEPCVTGHVECSDKKDYPELRGRPGHGAGYSYLHCHYCCHPAKTLLYFCAQYCHPRVHTEASVKLSGALPADYQVGNPMLPLLACSLSKRGSQLDSGTVLPPCKRRGAYMEPVM